MTDVISLSEGQEVWINLPCNEALQVRLDPPVLAGSQLRINFWPRPEHCSDSHFIDRPAIRALLAAGWSCSLTSDRRWRSPDGTPLDEWLAEGRPLPADREAYAAFISAFYHHDAADAGELDQLDALACSLDPSTPLSTSSQQ